MADDHPAALVLDSQGLGEAARGAPVLRAVIRRARDAGVPVVVSAVTLAEVLRGHPRDAAVHVFLKGCRVEPVTAVLGRAAGELLGRRGRTDTVDAVVVVTAATLPMPVTVLTSDPGDVGALAEGISGVRVGVV